MSIGFSRLGADLLVAPADALINITAGLLTVEPTNQTVPVDLMAAPISGVARIAPQRVLRTDQSGFGGHGESVDLIGFDRERDFTVQSWIAERLGRQMQAGDVIYRRRARPAGRIGDRVVRAAVPYLRQAEPQRRRHA